ncbi:MULTISPECIES: DUF6380 family protein [unclassified Streptomyces]
MDTPLPGGKRRATLRREPASPTETAGRTRSERRGGRSGEGAP